MISTDQAPSFTLSRACDARRMTLGACVGVSAKVVVGGARGEVDHRDTFLVLVSCCVHDTFT